MGMDIMTICSTCLMVMNTANRDLNKDPALLKRINKVIGKVGLKYSGNIKVKQLLWVLAEDYGLNNLKRKIKRPISRLRVAPFYGCHSLRPSDALGFDDPERPWSLEATINAIGADVVEYVGKTKCCGFQVDLVTEDAAVEMTGIRLLDAKQHGAITTRAWQRKNSHRRFPCQYSTSLNLSGLPWAWTQGSWGSHATWFPRRRYLRVFNG
jgi:succinate dehydrogenase / fumarate reductase cytochrome b subunit